MVFESFIIGDIKTIDKAIEDFVKISLWDLFLMQKCVAN